MDFGKLFNKEISKKRKKMTVIFLVSGIGLTIYALIRGLTDFEPKVFVLMASLVGLIISGFAIGGKLLQDISSGKKQQQILEKTTVTLETATNNFAISQKIDNNTTKTNVLSELINENINLLKQQNEKIKQQNTQIEEISKAQSDYLKNITKSIKDSENENKRKDYLEFEKLKGDLLSNIFLINSSLKSEFLKLNEAEKIKYLNRFKINLEGLIQHPYLKLNIDLLDRLHFLVFRPIPVYILTLESFKNNKNETFGTVYKGKKITDFKEYEPIMYDEIANSFDFSEIQNLPFKITIK